MNRKIGFLSLLLSVLTGDARVGARCGRGYEV